MTMTPRTPAEQRQFEKDLADENRKIENWMSNHPYPELSTIIARVKSLGKSKEMRFVLISMLAEYGEFNHDCLKKIYDSKFDPDIVREMGIAINERGGLCAMQQNCSLFMKIGPFFESRDPIVYYAGQKLERMWDGIGDFVW